MSIQEMAVENADKRLKDIDKLDFTISAWADYDNGLTQGFKDGAKAMLEKACDWLLQNANDYDCLVSEDLMRDFKKTLGE